MAESFFDAVTCVLPIPFLPSHDQFPECDRAAPSDDGVWRRRSIHKCSIERRAILSEIRDVLLPLADDFDQAACWAARGYERPSSVTHLISVLTME